MSKYILELKNFPVEVGNIQVASHLYWAIKDTATGKYVKNAVFHGGAFGKDGWENVGFHPDKTGFTNSVELPGQDSNQSISVMEINSEAELNSILNVINSVGTEINNMGESYVLLGDNSNSVAYLLGRAIGLSDEQLLALESKMTTGLAGAPGFGDDLLDGGDGEHAGLTVEEFLEKAKESGVLTDEQISQLQKLEEQLSDKFPAGIDEEDHQSDEAQIGKAIADLIKQYQHHDSDLEEFLSDAVIETLMQNAGEVAYYLRQGASLENAVSNAQHDIVGDMGQVSQDMIGSLITDAYWEKNKQLSESLGIDNSVAGQALDIAVSQAISLAVSQGVDIGLDFVGASIGSSGSWGGYGAGLNNAVAGAIGSYLADELLEGQVNSEAEAIGVQLGKTVGGIIGSYFGPIGTGVGTFIGAMAGDFAGEQWNELDDIWDKGNVIDNIADTVWLEMTSPITSLEHAFNLITSYGKKPPPPTAHARMEWDAEQGEYVVVSSDSADGGNRQAMLDMAQAATAQVQALLEASGGQIIDPSQIQPITFSQHDGDFFFNGTGGNPNELISRAVISSLQQIEIEGGDSTIKRVIYETEATDLGEMMGQIQSGKKWELYTEETPVILNAQGEPVTDKEGVDAFKAAVASLEAGDLSGEEFSSSYTVSTYKSYVDNLLETDPESEAAQEWTQALQITEQFPLAGDHYSDDYSRLGYLAQHNGGFSLFDKDINDFVFEVNRATRKTENYKNAA